MSTGLGEYHKYLVDDYEPASFTVNLAFKDLGLGLELAKQLRVPMKFIQTAYDEFDEARQRGWGEHDSRKPMKIQNERAGITIKITPGGSQTNARLRLSGCKVPEAGFLRDAQSAQL